MLRRFIILLLIVTSCSKAGFHGFGNKSTVKSNRTNDANSIPGDIITGQNPNSPDGKPFNPENTPDPNVKSTSTPTPNTSSSPTPAPTCAPENILVEDSGSWKSNTDQMPAARANAVSSVIGSNLVIWGGLTDYHGASTNQGFSLDLNSNQRTLLNGVNQPSARAADGAANIGGNFVVWGSKDFLTSSGGIYSPTSQTWTPTSLVNAPSRRKNSLVLTGGNKLFVWGGLGCSGALLNDGGLLDPSTNTWEPIPSSPILAGRYNPSGVWTGTEFFVWSGSGNSAALTDGALFNPVTKTWRALSTNGAPSGKINSVVAWTGSEIIVWAGQTDVFSTAATGAIYNPTSNSWRPMNSTGFDNISTGAQGIWTSNGLFVCGAYQLSARTNCFLYSIANDNWTTLSPFPRQGVGGYTMNIANNKIYIYGGYSPGSGSIFLPNLQIFDLASKTWSSLNPNLPVDYYIAQGQSLTGGALDSGQMFVYGADVWDFSPSNFNIFGYVNFSGYLISPDLSRRKANLSAIPNLVFPAYASKGKDIYLFGSSQFDPNSAALYKYDSQSDSSSKLIANGTAPSPRKLQTSAASPNHFFVWSGILNNESTVNTSGAIYNFANNTWSATSQTGAPSGRGQGYSAWTGTDFIVWGGYAPGFNQDGGLYNPNTNTWKMMAKAPVTFSSQPSVVWSGDRLFVYGPSGSIPSQQSNLISYLPSSDTWIVHSSDKIPYGRDYTSILWTGTGIIAWGGTYSIYSGDYSASGGYYDLATDKWIRLSSNSSVGGIVGTRFSVSAWLSQKAIFVGGSQGGMLTSQIVSYQPGW